MNKFIFDAKPHKCCRGILYNENENMTNCCGDRIYDITKYVCCGGKLTERKQDSLLDCCDDKVYDVRKASCCGDKVQLMSHWKLVAKCPTFGFNLSIESIFEFIYSQINLHKIARLISSQKFQLIKII
jgi:hypothetical protein